MDTLWLALAGLFAATTLLLVAVQSYAFDRYLTYRSLRAMRAFELRPDQVRIRDLARPAPSRLLLPGLKRLGDLARRLTPLGVMDRLRLQLVYAGSPPAWDAERILAVKAVLGLGLALATVLLGTTTGMAPVRLVTATALAGVLGYLAPDAVLRSRAQRRQDEIRLALADSLDLLSITVEAGLAFDAALARVAREVRGPLGAELHRAVQEIQLGKPRVEALRALGARTQVRELKGFVLAMVQADIFGISVANVLHTQAQEMRIKRRQAAEERAQKIPVKMIFPLIFFIMPATFVVLAGPGVLRIFEFFAR